MAKIMRQVQQCDFCNNAEPERWIANCAVCGKAVCSTDSKGLRVEGLGFRGTHGEELTGFQLCLQHFDEAVAAMRNGLQAMDWATR